MANSSESFASVEQITSRPNFSASLEITVDSFSSLIGRYHLSESVQCQVKTEHGICGQKHQRGYVGLTKEGKEGLIGGVCGDKYFKEHTLFVQEKNRIDAEIDRRENIERLSYYKENFLSLSGKHGALIKDIQAIKKKTDHLYKGFPDIVLTYLYQAQKNKNWDLNVDVFRHSRGEEGMTNSWYIEKLCTFPPLPSAQEIKSLLGQVENLNSTFSEACSCDIEKIPTPRLKNYVRNISEISELEIRHAQLKKHIMEFTQESTLCNLYYACASNKDKSTTVRTILTLSDINVSDQMVKSKCADIENTIKKKFDNCQVRYNKKVMKFKKNSIG